MASIREGQSSSSNWRTQLGALDYSDDTDLSQFSRGILVASGGDVCLVAEGDSSETGVVYPNVPEWTFIPIDVKRINATGTTVPAGGIFGGI